MSDAQLVAQIIATALNEEAFEQRQYQHLVDRLKRMELLLADDRHTKQALKEQLQRCTAIAIEQMVSVLNTA